MAWEWDTSVPDVSSVEEEELVEAKMWLAVGSSHCDEAGNIYRVALLPQF